MIPNLILSFLVTWGGLGAPWQPPHNWYFDTLGVDTLYVIYINMRDGDIDSVRKATIDTIIAKYNHILVINDSVKITGVLKVDSITGDSPGKVAIGADTVNLGGSNVGVRAGDTLHTDFIRAANDVLTIGWRPSDTIMISPSYTEMTSNFYIPYRTTSDGGEVRGIYSFTRNEGAAGVVGGRFETDSYGGGEHWGVRALAGAPLGNLQGAYGIEGYADQPESGVAIGGWFRTSSSGTGDHYGVKVSGKGGTNAYGIWASATGGSSNNYAGYFDGDIKSTGILYVDSITGDSPGRVAIGADTVTLGANVSVQAGDTFFTDWVVPTNSKTAFGRSGANDTMDFTNATVLGVGGGGAEADTGKFNFIVPKDSTKVRMHAEVDDTALCITADSQGVALHLKHSTYSLYNTKALLEVDAWNHIGGGIRVNSGYRGIEVSPNCDHGFVGGASPGGTFYACHPKKGLVVENCASNGRGVELRDIYMPGTKGLYAYGYSGATSASTLVELWNKSTGESKQYTLKIITDVSDAPAIDIISGNDTSSITGDGDAYFAGNWTWDGYIKPDTSYLPIKTTPEGTITGWARQFVDTVGTDSLIIYIGATRRGVAIE